MERETCVAVGCISKVLCHSLNCLLWHSCPPTIKPSCRRPSARDLRHLSRTSIQVWHTLARSALRDPRRRDAHVSRKRKPLCQAAIAPPSSPASPASPLPTTTSQYLPFPLKPSTPPTALVRSQGRQVNPNCMLIRALRTSP